MKQQEQHIFVSTDESDDGNKLTKSSNSNLTQTVIDRVAQLSKQSNQDKVIELMQMDKVRLEQHVSRLQQKNRSLKAKVAELNQAVNHLKHDNAGEGKSNRESVDLRKEVVGIKEFMAQIAASANQKLEKVKFRDLNHQLSLKQTEIDRMTHGYDEMLKIQRSQAQEISLLTRSVRASQSQLLLAATKDQNHQLKQKRHLRLPSTMAMTQSRQSLPMLPELESNSGYLKEMKEIAKPLQLPFKVKREDILVEVFNDEDKDMEGSNQAQTLLTRKEKTITATMEALAKHNSLGKVAKAIQGAFTDAFNDDVAVIGIEDAGGRGERKRASSAVVVECAPKLCQPYLRVQVKAFQFFLIE